MTNLVIIDGVRTPFVKAGTALKDVGAVELGRTAVSALLTKTGIDPAIIDETILGCVSQPADAANIARVVALRAGIPESTPAMTVHRNCASGMESLTTAAERVASGKGEVFVVGGTESMSQTPFLYRRSAVEKFTVLSRAKTFWKRLAAMAKFRPKDFSPVIGLKLGLSDPVCGLNMGQTAEVLAREFEISRDEQDEYALQSHLKAAAANEQLLKEQTPVYFDGAKGKHVIGDNGVRAKQTIEALTKLRAVFAKEHGSVTAGNASQITDGAVALLVMTEARAEKLGLEPLGRLVDYAYAGCSPERMGTGPAYAIGKLKSSCGFDPSDADVVELNEAFAVQVLAVLELLKDAGFARENGFGESAIGAVDLEKLNPLGGAIALGHPVGASAARLVLTALTQLKENGGKRALVSMCIGGGQGGAAWLERI
ncbi:MAG: acetyl-CoA acetyltransferase family protein [Verrucomicrobiales bacterium]|jgi:acetyl-CoA acetyltransferase family protein